MKVKLLKKLRKKVFILQRNNEYKLVTPYGDMDWDTDKNAVFAMRRWYILFDAQEYKTVKKVL